MAQGPETKFCQGVNRHLPSTIHREKMHNPYRGGTPDWYYEYKAGCIWVEAKYTTPREIICITDDRYFLTELQKMWLYRAYGNGVNVAVMVGWEKGGVMFPNPKIWDDEVPWSTFVERTITKKEVAEWIQSQVSKRRKT